MFRHEKILDGKFHKEVSLSTLECFWREEKDCKHLSYNLSTSIGTEMQKVLLHFFESVTENISFLFPC